ncbi:MAG TPA: beta-ketoacyl synthase N-terminal-like domain-containing protein [Dissulfurispiraceae bacterium]|nr:beta-ketoacyl synthase N-terminal-like domain-containing protein [Dissulfurispiraceae bacterium]
MNMIGKFTLEDIDIENALLKLEGHMKPIRLVHDIERLAVASVGLALLASGIKCPYGGSDIGLYLGIDDSIEDIKDEYFRRVLADGALGASPLLFPFTSPNALAAQISIAFDLRGECIVMPINGSCSNVIKYATECIDSKHVRTAIVCVIKIAANGQSGPNGQYVGDVMVFGGGCEQQKK